MEKYLFDALGQDKSPVESEEKRIQYLYKLKILKNTKKRTYWIRRTKELETRLDFPCIISKFNRTELNNTITILDEKDAKKKQYTSFWALTWREQLRKPRRSLKTFIKPSWVRLRGRFRIISLADISLTSKLLINFSDLY